MPRRRPIPVIVWIGAAFGVALVTLPLIGLLVRAPWGRAREIATSPATAEALRLSLIVSVSAALVALVLGIPVAWVLARRDFRGRALVRALVVLPLVLPPVVGGLALISAFGRRGVLGGWLYGALGVQVTFTTTAAILAGAFVSFPLLVLAVEAGLRSIDPGLEDAAAASGGRPWYVARRVTLPLLAPSIVAGAILAWARALGEFGATLMFAGNLRGRTQTLPLAVFELSQVDPVGAAIPALLLVLLSLIVLVTLRRRFLG